MKYLLKIRTSGNRTSQTMTEAEHNRPNLKLSGNRPLALTAEVFCETIRPIVSQNIFKKILRIVPFFAPRLQRSLA